MGNDKQSKIDAYADGLSAAYRTGKYDGFKNCPECPYANGTNEADSWWDGF